MYRPIQEHVPSIIPDKDAPLNASSQILDINTESVDQCSTHCDMSQHITEIDGNQSDDDYIHVRSNMTHSIDKAVHLMGTNEYHQSVHTLVNNTNKEDNSSFNTRYQNQDKDLKVLV